jgi:hypothetical protein
MIKIRYPLVAAHALLSLFSLILLCKELEVPYIYGSVIGVRLEVPYIYGSVIGVRLEVP